jgi:peptide/nickel transport system substrate-binding protein
MFERFKHLYLSFSPGERRAFLGAAALFAVGLVALGVVLFRNGTAVVPSRGGDYTEGIVGQPSYVNPVLASSDADRALVRLLFASLSDIADKTDVDTTGRVWKIRLKEGLRWSDGEKLTSDDVIFTVERIQDPNAQSPLFASWQGVAASRLSELELQFNLVNPYPFFAENLRELFILPKHLFAETPPANWRLSEFNLKPVSSGPYRFVSYEQERNGFIGVYRLATNPRAARGRPFLDNLAIRFFPNDDDLVAAFNAGTIDGFADPHQELVGRVNRPYDAVAFTLPSYFAVFLNQSQNLALKDAAVREALDLAVDRAALVNDVFRGRATPVTDPIPAGADLPLAAAASSSSPDAAQALLDRQGWKTNADGFRAKAVKGGSVKLEFTLTVPQIPFLMTTASALEQSWRAIGAHVMVRIISVDDVAARVIKNREYQALLFGNSVNPPSDLYPFWHSSERFYPGLNLALYSDKKADQFLEAIRRDFDPASRAAELAALRATIADDHPAIFLYSPQYLYLTARNLQGVPGGLIMEPADRFRSVSEWYLKTSRALK